LHQHAYSAIEHDAAALSAAFYKELEMLWPAEEPADSIPSLTALMLACECCAIQGKDSRAYRLMAAGRQMAARLGIMGVSDEEATVALARHNSDQDWLKAASSAAWGAFNWVTSVPSQPRLPPCRKNADGLSLGSRTRAFYYGDRQGRYPPMLPIPGTNPEADEKMQIRTPLPPYKGQIFPRLTALILIMHQVSLMYDADSDKQLSERIPLAFAEAKYRKLLAWADGLEDEMALGEYTPRHVLILHNFYHALIVNLFLPFVSQPRIHRLRTFISSDSYVELVYSASVTQLKRLTHAFRSQHGRITTIWFNLGLVMFNSAVLNALSDPRAKLNLMLCIRGLQDLASCYPIVAGVLEATLYTAIQYDSVISKREARTLMDEVRQRWPGAPAQGESGAATLVPTPQATFFYDFNKAMTAPVDAQVNTVARQFEDLELFDDFTNMDSSP
jgi:hypothetical protein